MGRLCCELTAAEIHAVGTVRVGGSRSNRQMRRQGRRQKRSPFMPRVLRVGRARGLERRRHRHHSGRCVDCELTVATMFAESSHRPLEEIAAGGTPREAQSSEAVEVGQLRDVEIRVRRVESAGRLRGYAERCNGKRERRVSTGELRTSVGHLEELSIPMERPVERGEPIVVEAGNLRVEISDQIVTAAIEMKGAREVAVATERPRFVFEEDLPHALELHTRLDLVGHLRPVVEVEIAAGMADGAVGRHVDAIEVQLRSIDEEVRAKIGPHGHVVLNGHEAAVERRVTVVAVAVGDVDVDIRRENAPLRFVVLVRKLSAVRVQRPHRRREALRPRRIGAVPAAQAHEVVAVGPLLDQHLPIGHLHRGDDELGLSSEGFGPVERDGQPFGCEKGPIGRGQSLDREVVHFEQTSCDANREAANVDRTPDLIGSLSFGQCPQ